jgi:hypothetical protein
MGIADVYDQCEPGLIRRAVCAGGKAGFAGKSLHKISVFYLELYKHMEVKGHDI